MECSRTIVMIHSWDTWWGERLFPDQPQSATNTGGYFRALRGIDPTTLKSTNGIQNIMYAGAPCANKESCHSKCGPPPPGVNSYAPYAYSCSFYGAGHTCSFTCNSGYVYRNDVSDSTSCHGHVHDQMQRHTAYSAETRTTVCYGPPTELMKKVV